MTYYILCTITHIISYPVPISSLLSCSGYTPMLYYSFLTYCFIIYFLIRSCNVIYFAFCVFTLTIELTFTTDLRGNQVLFVIQLQCNFAFNSMIHFDYRIDIHDRFERESRHVCHSVAM